MASTIKVTNIDTPDNTGNIIVDRPLSGSGASLTNLPAANLTGTIDGARFPATLPASDGSALTNIVHTPADNSVTGAKLDISLVAGDTIYASATDTLAKLAKGTDGHILTLASGIPSWAAAAAGGGQYKQIVNYYQANTAFSNTHDPGSVGFEPKALVLYGNINGQNSGSWGIAHKTGPNSAVGHCVHHATNSTFNYSTTAVGVFSHTGGSSSLSVTGWDSDGVTMTNSVWSNPGTGFVFYAVLFFG